MIWFFDRNAQSVRLETHFDNDTSEYVLILKWPDSREQIERFADAEEYGQRLAAIEKALESEQWIRSGPPVILPDGWRNR